MIGTRVGKYTITQEIGDGGHAFVFKGEGPNGEAVAIKMLKPSVAGEDSLEKRFVLEAEALKKLKHPHIVDFYDYIYKDGYHYLVLELMDQGSVEDLIKTMGAVPPRYAVPIFYNVLDAIDFSHNHGYIHRDLKPNNILINSEGQAKLTDFGITKVVGGQNLTRKGFVLGTTLYMAPEFISQGVVSIKTDVYALGVTFYEMLTSHKPFEYEREDEPLRDFALRVCQGKATPPTAYKPLPPQLERIVMKSIAQNPKDRYKSAKEFRRDLARNFPDLINRDIVIPSGRAMTRYVKIDDLKDLGPKVATRETGTGGLPVGIRAAIAATALIIALGSAHLAPTWFPDELGKTSPGLIYGLGGGVGLLVAFLLYFMLPRPRRHLQAAPAMAPAAATQEESSVSGFDQEDSSIPEFEDTIPFADQYRSNKPATMTENSELNAYLVVISGPDKGRRFGLRPVSRIGRDLRLDIRPHDPEISRHHTTITFDGRGFTVEDLNSTNGTFLNEERVSGKRALKSGDIIRVGSSSMRFEFGGAAG
ncbi:MAG: protein kinase [Planctomycetes bacterium]|nr:protein kinase [Planctomycetota bacterium]